MVEVRTMQHFYQTNRDNHKKKHGNVDKFAKTGNIYLGEQANDDNVETKVAVNVGWSVC